MKKYIIIILIIIFILIGISIIYYVIQCNSEYDYVGEFHFKIYNHTNSTKEVTLILNDSSGLEIYNKTFSVHSDEKLETEKINKNEGTYVLIVKTEDNMNSKEVKIGQGYVSPAIHIKSDEIKISQAVDD